MVKFKITKSAKETESFAKKFIKDILKENSNKAIVLGLSGDLGGGKTTFLKGLAKELNIKENVLSPTFLLMKRYGIKSNIKYNNLYHFDCYRIKEAKEILELGFKDIINNQNNIVAIEWVKRVKELLPKNTIYLNFIFIDENTRKITWKIK